ncbi:MAG: zinc ribbon domain-containing protein [Clostridiales bacterium]|nr:zinc ribbon domain-containing protein [Clostridiales bacterium]
MYCTNCGEKLPNKAQFCHFCGTEQGFISPVTPSESTAPKKKLNPLWIILVVPLVILCVAAALILIRQSRSIRFMQAMKEIARKSSRSQIVNYEATQVPDFGAFTGWELESTEDSYPGWTSYSYYTGDKSDFGEKFAETRPICLAYIALLEELGYENTTSEISAEEIYVDYRKGDIEVNIHCLDYLTFITIYD